MNKVKTTTSKHYVASYGTVVSPKSFLNSYSTTNSGNNKFFNKNNENGTT